MDHNFQSANPHGNVVMNFTASPIQDLPVFALGYHRAGKVLASRLAESRGYADYDGYPVLFLYRHALELYLKALVYRGALLMGLIGKKDASPPGLFERHELSRLLPALRSIFYELKWNFTETSFSSIDEFIAVIQSVDAIDPRSFAFRYPMDRTGEAHLPRHFVINTIVFTEKLDEVFSLLDGAAIELGEHLEFEAESRYELQQVINFFSEV